MLLKIILTALCEYVTSECMQDVKSESTINRKEAVMEVWARRARGLGK